MRKSEGGTEMSGNIAGLARRVMWTISRDRIFRRSTFGRISNWTGRSFDSEHLNAAVELTDRNVERGSAIGSH